MPYMQYLHDRWLEAGMPVKRHLCQGMAAYQTYLSGSAFGDPHMPRFTHEGFTESEEACNRVAIRFCPFCGKPLKEVTNVD